MSAAVIKDKSSGESLGFGFVEMPNKEEAEFERIPLTAAEESAQYK